MQHVLTHLNRIVELTDSVYDDDLTTGCDNSYGEGGRMSCSP